MKAVVAVSACLLILAACGGMGALGAARLKGRVRYLEGAGAGVEALLREVEQLASPLPLALDRAAREGEAASPLFAAAAERLNNGDGLTAGEAFLQALAEQELEQDLKSELAVLAAGLGETDLRLQLRQLSACREQLRRAGQGAQEEYARFGKIWRAMGWCGGAVIILLLV